MQDSTLYLTNQKARRLWLHLQGMLEAPHNSASGHCALDTIRQLGMVQLDSIATIARAHHHILWSRHSAYRQDDYNSLLGKNPTAFEHFSHDAVILPLDIYPYWRRQQQRRSHAYTNGTWGKQIPGSKLHRQVLSAIQSNGPMCSRDFAKIHKQRADRSVHAWMRPPHKLALEYLWLKGELCVSHREGFSKHYDLHDRLVPASYRVDKVNDAAQIDFLCRSALQRLGFATAADIQRFYEACDLAEVRQWLALKTTKTCTVNVQAHNGDSVSMVAPADIDNTIEALPEPSRRLRIVNPFDPIIRDRARLKMLFGMDYRIEIYTPAVKRKYGYYVFPIVEGDKVIARIDARANKDTDTLEVKAWWLEPGTRHSESRIKRLRSELGRLARLARVTYVSDIPRASPHP